MSRSRQMLSSLALLRNHLRFRHINNVKHHILPTTYVSTTLTCHRNITTTGGRYKKWIDEEDLEESTVDDYWLNDPQYKDAFTDSHLIPSGSHRVFVIQPEYKGSFKPKSQTTPDHQLAEACTLVETLPGWSVVNKGVYSTKAIDKKHIFTKGKFEEVTSLVHKCRQKTAIFVSVDMLKPAQLINLRARWKVPIYDRFSIVLQIFKTRAKTKEAKLQVALAEIPYFRSRLKAFHDGKIDRHRGGMGAIGGSGETYIQMRQQLLQEREIKLKKAIEKLREKREMIRKERMKKEFPVVAVIGYTNAGKTSLIKALTGEEDMQPKDQLFATLDVTAHGGVLPNNMKVIYMDTVGFISDIPITLVEAFRVTLHDVLIADVVLHVRDISHPDTIAQRVNVIDTLLNLQVSPQLWQNTIEVCNKVDLLHKHQRPDDQSIVASCTTGEGLQQLAQQIEKAVISNTHRVRKRIKISMGGPILGWLYKEATIEHTEADENDPEKLIVDVVMTNATYAKFNNQFSKRTEE